MRIKNKPLWVVFVLPQALFDDYDNGDNDDYYDNYGNQDDHDDHYRSYNQTFMGLLRSTSGIALDCSIVPKEVIIHPTYYDDDHDHD